jgi:nucleoside-diphosphate-sugar epimerase
MNKVLVTGATGFVGGRLVPHLLREGKEVRVFVRQADRLDRSFRSQVDVVEGCLESENDVDRAISGCGQVFHLAALARAHVRDPRDYFRINTDSVEMLLRSSARQGVRRFVHVSSVLALPPEKWSAAWGISRRPTHYGESKRESELLVRKYVADGHDAVMVRPGRVYGPGPWNDANGVTRMMAMYLEGRFRFQLADGDVQANYVHVDDVAAGLALAARKGRCGEAYALGGENASLADFLGTVADITGVHRRLLRIPPQTVLPVAHLCSWWGQCGGSVSLTPAWLNNFLEHRPLDITSSKIDLGYAPRSLRTGLSQTLNWLLGIGGGEQNVNRSIHRFKESGA